MGKTLADGDDALMTLYLNFNNNLLTQDSEKLVTKAKVFVSALGCNVYSI